MMKARETKTMKKRPPNLFEAMIPIVAMIAVLFVGKGLLGYSLEFLLIVSSIIAGLVALRVGVTWRDVESAVSQKIADSFPAILVYLIVGVMIGSWMASGTIPMLIYYGSQLISPNYLPVTAFFACAVISVCTGTSWGSAGTMGVAIMGIAMVLNVPLAPTAGAVISGCYFGDKLSPMSDTTNLAPIAAGAKLYDHIGHMLYTTIPATIVAVIVYFFVGRSFNVMDGSMSESVLQMLITMDEMYSWNILLLIPLVIVLAGSIMKKPTVPVMVIATIVACIEAILFQHCSLLNVTNAMINGFNLTMLGGDIATASPIAISLLNRGGLSSMMSTTQVILCAMTFAGVLSSSGSLDVLLQNLLKVVKTIRGLIISTIGTVLLMVVTTGSSYCALLIPGELFRDAYKKKGLAPRNLSRTLEDAGTVILPLIPWTGAGVYMTSTLGISPLEYAPWAIMNYAGLLFAIFYACTGFTIKKLEPEEKEDKNGEEITKCT